MAQRRDANQDHREEAKARLDSIAKDKGELFLASDDEMMEDVSVAVVAKDSKKKRASRSGSRTSLSELATQKEARKKVEAEEATERERIVSQNFALIVNETGKQSRAMQEAMATQQRDNMELQREILASNAASQKASVDAIKDMMALFITAMSNMAKK